MISLFKNLKINFRIFFINNYNIRNYLITNNNNDNDNNNNNDLNRIIEIINSMKNSKYFEIAFTHKSCKDYNPSIKTYDTLEFLGDSLLNTYITIFLYHSFPEKDEGQLTLLRSTLVDTKNLSEKSLKIGLDKFLKLGKKTIDISSNPLNKKDSKILADIFESFIAALYLEKDKSILLEFISLTILDEPQFKDKLKDFGYNLIAYLYYDNQYINNLIIERFNNLEKILTKQNEIIKPPLIKEQYNMNLSLTEVRDTRTLIIELDNLIKNLNNNLNKNSIINKELINDLRSLGDYNYFNKESQVMNSFNKLVAINPNFVGYMRHGITNEVTDIIINKLTMEINHLNRFNSIRNVNPITNVKILETNPFENFFKQNKPNSNYTLKLFLILLNTLLLLLLLSLLIFFINNPILLNELISKYYYKVIYLINQVIKLIKLNKDNEIQSKELDKTDNIELEEFNEIINETVNNEDEEINQDNIIIQPELEIDLNPFIEILINILIPIITSSLGDLYLNLYDYLNDYFNNTNNDITNINDSNNDKEDSDDSSSESSNESDYSNYDRFSELFSSIGNFITGIFISIGGLWQTLLGHFNGSNNSNNTNNDNYPDNFEANTSSLDSQKNLISNIDNQQLTINELNENLEKEKDKFNKLKEKYEVYREINQNNEDFIQEFVETFQPILEKNRLADERDAKYQVYFDQKMTELKEILEKFKNGILSEKEYEKQFKFVQDSILDKSHNMFDPIIPENSITLDNTTISSNLTNNNKSEQQLLDNDYINEILNKTSNKLKDLDNESLTISNNSNLLETYSKEGIQNFINFQKDKIEEIKTFTKESIDKNIQPNDFDELLNKFDNNQFNWNEYRIIN